MNKRLNHSEFLIGVGALGLFLGVLNPSSLSSGPGMSTGMVLLPGTSKAPKPIPICIISVLLLSAMVAVASSMTGCSTGKRDMGPIGRVSNAVIIEP